MSRSITKVTFWGFYLCMRIFHQVLATVPCGGIEAFWVADANLVDKVKDDTYLWLHTAVSRIRCTLECTMDSRCVSHFYREDNQTCIGQDLILDTNQVHTSVGYNFYIFMPVNCDPPYVYVRSINLCFWASTNKETHPTAKGICQANGGSLVKIDSEAKRNAITSHSSFDPMAISYYIDGTDGAIEGVFQYSDGCNITVDFWSSNNPKSDATPTETCIQMYSFSPYKWFSYDCITDPGYKFICEKTPT